MSAATITVRHCADRYGQPYLEITNVPLYLGCEVNMYPAQARAYAQVLLQAAADAEAMWAVKPTGRGKPRVPVAVRKTYALDPRSVA